jgi:hypothetical protein
MLAWSWGTWPDVLVDFGRDLYVAWQLAEGRSLYVDVEHVLGGPLSPYLNSLWFRIFGVGLRTLVIANAVVLAVILALLHALLSGIGNRLSAAVACLVVVFVFAFAQLDPIGNYNFICPYRHEITHGLLLSLGTLVCLRNHLRSADPRWLLGAGLCVGLSLLTKIEMFLAGAAAASVGVAGALRARHREGRRIVGPLAGFLAGCAGPFLIALALLSTAMPFSQALRGMLGPWSAMLSPAYARSSFQLQVMGLDEPGENLAALLRVAAGSVALLVAAAFLARAVATSGRARRIAPPVLLVVTGVALAVAPVPWPDVLRPLPLILLGWIAILVARLGRAEAAIDAQERQHVLELSMAVFAAVLLGKVLFNVHAYHYGFALAMPATALFVVVLLSHLPEELRRRGAEPRVFQAVALGAICVAIAVHVDASRFWWARKTWRVGTGADSFLADERAVAVNGALSAIARQTRPTETLAVFPEGHMLSYLARRRSPTRYIDFMPTELGYFGEGVLLDALRAKPPDFIALVHKDTGEYGARFFGRDYAQGIGSWIKSGYRPVSLSGDVPLQSERFGILLLRRQ